MKYAAPYNAILNGWRHSRMDTMSDIPVTTREFRNLSYVQLVELKSKRPEMYQQMVDAVQSETQSTGGCY